MLRQDMTVAELAKELKVSRPTVYRAMDALRLTRTALKEIFTRFLKCVCKLILSTYISFLTNLKKDRAENKALKLKVEELEYKVMKLEAAALDPRIFEI